MSLTPNNNISTNANNNNDDNADTMIYIVLGLLVLGFLFFVGNTIRCYLNRPRFIDEEEDEMTDQVEN